jgi:hypothetical protein
MSPELKQKLILDIEEKILLASILSAILKINQNTQNTGSGEFVPGTQIPSFIKIPIAVVEIFVTVDTRTNV